MSVFVDTSVWYAAVDSDDVSHERARRVVEGAGDLVTSDHVLVESVALIGRRAGWMVAERFLRGVRDGIARVEMTISADLDVASDIGVQFADQEFSLVDRTSFAVMRRLGIMQAASLGKDFAVYRFGPANRRGFEIVV